MNRTAQRARRSRLGRGLLAAAVAGVCVVGASACTSTVSGEAAPSDGGLFGVGVGSSGTSGARAAITAAGLDSVTCGANQFPFDTYCTIPQPSAKYTPSGSSLTLRAGDVIALSTNGGATRACTIGAFAKDSGGAVWALSGAGCATSVGTAATLDGYRVGEVKTIIVRTGTIRYMPAIKLGENVKWSQDAKSVGTSTAVSQAVTARTPHGDVKWAGTNANALLWRGPGAAPAMKPGDAGSPVVADGVLVGLADQTNRVTPVDQLAQVLSGIGAGTALAT